LELEAPPERIEIYDNSHIQGSKAVGAMVVAGPEGFLKNQYRKFNIREAQSNDDFAMMREVMQRRFRKLAEEGEDLSTARDEREDKLDTVRPEQRSSGAERSRERGSRGSRDSHQTLWPDLVLIDGGKGQMSAVRDTLEEMGIENVPLIAIAKGTDHGREGREVFHFPDGREKTLPVNSPLLFHLQRLRDEVHRYAIGAHRDKRSRAISASPLDEIPGIGPARKRALLLHFGTASKVRAAALEDLQRAPGVSDAVARKVYDFYHAGG
jgi:excinuclease ABC subunit C